MTAQDDVRQSEKDLGLAVEDHPTQSFIVWLLVVIWVALGILGFLASIVCFAGEGSFLHNWIGFLTAVTLGPFYWIYFAFAGEKYCSMGQGETKQSKPTKQKQSKTAPSRTKSAKK